MTTRYPQPILSRGKPAPVLVTKGETRRTPIVARCLACGLTFTARSWLTLAEWTTLVNADGERYDLRRCPCGNGVSLRIEPRRHWLRTAALLVAVAALGCGVWWVVP